MTADTSPLQPASVRASRRALTDELFAALTDTDAGERRRIRARIATVNMRVARSIARRFRGRGESDADLEQVAYLGLVKAVNGFDPAQDNDFLSYAMPTISGELKRHFRDHCWFVRPPRRIQDLQKRIATTTESLGQDLDHEPSARELAAYLHIDATVIEEALSTGCFDPIPLDRGGDASEAGRGSDRICVDDHGYVETDAVVLLAPYVRTLPLPLRQLLGMRYFRDWTQDHIARELGISQVQVSRLLNRVLAGLREQIDPGP